MASVNSPIRKFVKPILYKLLGNNIYLWFQFYGKLRDINNKLVEEKEMELLPDFIKEGSETLDIGANYAYYSVRMAKLVGNTGKVYAFEPIYFTSKIFKKIVKYFGLGNIIFFQKGAGDSNEKISFNVPLQDFGAPSTSMSHFARRNNELEEKEKFYVFDKHEIQECDVIRIDDFLLPKLKDLSFVKIDIEGAEYYALKGMVKTLMCFKPVIIVEIQPFFLKGFGIPENEILDLIENIGYKMFLYQQEIRKLMPFTPPLIDSNYILIPRDHLSNYDHILG